MKAERFPRNPLESVPVNRVGDISLGYRYSEARRMHRRTTGVNVEAACAEPATGFEQAEVIATSAQSGSLAESADRVRPV